jgi:STE24 endopeptidase
MRRTACCATLGFAVFCLAATNGAAHQIPDGATRAVSVQRIDAEEPVRVPAPTDQALRRHREGVVLWLVGQVWGLALPAFFLFSGYSARLRTWAEGRRQRRPWPLVLAIYLASYSVLAFVLTLPLSYYRGFAWPKAYGLSNQSLGQWFGTAVTRLVVAPPAPPPLHFVGIVSGIVMVTVLYWLVRRSPRRWWLYMPAALIPLLLVFQFIEPVAINPLFYNYARIGDTVAEGRLLGLADRAGIEGARVYEAASRNGRPIGATVEGFLGTRRIVLSPGVVEQSNERELLAVMGHEMGHYALSHGVKRILVGSTVILVVLFLVAATASQLIRAFRTRFGFDHLADVASLPLLLLLLNLFFLGATPVILAYGRHTEHEADRFALELTRDNRAVATLWVKGMQRNRVVPRPGWFPYWWRGTHQTHGDRIDFANEYRPWESGAPTRYGHLFK